MSSDGSYEPPAIGNGGGIGALIASLGSSVPYEIVRFSRGSHQYDLVMRLFLTGMGNLATPDSIVGIHRFVPKSGAKMARLKLFTQQAATTIARHGTLNMRNGWFGTSFPGMADILFQGFSIGNGLTVGGPLGSGVYLAPQHLAFTSVGNCYPDEEGLEYMVMCQVILGNAETVPMGSHWKFLPSSVEFDCAVDHPTFPSTYMIWNFMSGPCDNLQDYGVESSFNVPTNTNSCLNRIYLIRIGSYIYIYIRWNMSPWREGGLFCKCPPVVPVYQHHIHLCRKLQTIIPPELEIIQNFKIMVCITLLLMHRESLVRLMVLMIIVGGIGKSLRQWSSLSETLILHQILGKGPLSRLILQQCPKNPMGKTLEATEINFPCEIKGFVPTDRSSHVVTMN